MKAPTHCGLELCYIIAHKGQGTVQQRLASCFHVSTKIMIGLQVVRRGSMQGSHTEAVVSPGVREKGLFIRDCI